MQNLSNTQTENLAKFGLDILNIAGTTETMNYLLQAIHAVESSSAIINTQAVRDTLMWLAYNLSKVELQAKFSGQSLAEYTGCTYEDDTY